MGRECARCLYFTAYYTKAYCRFLRTDCGMCWQSRTEVKKKSSCDKWEGRGYQSKKRRQHIIDELGEALTTINAIKLILDEEKGENL